MTWKIISSLLIACTLPAASAYGELLTYTYNGTVFETKGLNGSSDPFFIGQTFSGTFTIDTDDADSNPDTDYGDYPNAVKELNAHFPGVTYDVDYVNNDFYHIRNASDGFTDFLQFGAEVTGAEVTGEFGVVTPQWMYLQFQAVAYAALSSDQIGRLPDFDDWGGPGANRGHLFFGGGTEQTLVEFWINDYSLEISSVPEPSSLVLLPPAFLALSVMARKMRRPGKTRPRSNQ